MVPLMHSTKEGEITKPYVQILILSPAAFVGCRSQIKDVSLFGKGRMMMRNTMIIGSMVAAGMLAASASAQFNYTGSYGWEDGATTLGQFGDNLTTENSIEQANSGTASLKMIESPLSGTPQAYVSFIQNLTDGDLITVGFWCYDTTPGVNPSGRIWGHYATADDVNNYKGSASGNSTYSDGNGWSYLEYTWTFDSAVGTRDALVVEARIYSGTDGDFIYIDDVNVDVTSANDNVVINFPVPAPCLDLAVTNLVAGQTATFTITGGTPSAKVVTVYGLNAGETVVNDVAGYCATFGIQGVRQNSIIGGLNLTFDANGLATFDQPIPANAQGVNVLFQSAENGTCPDECTSGAVAMTVG